MRPDRVGLKNHSHLSLVRRNENIAARHGHGCAIDENLAIIRFLQTRNQPERRGLTAARRAKQGENFTGLNRKADAIDRTNRAKKLGDTAELEYRFCHESAPER